MDKETKTGTSTSLHSKWMANWAMLRKVETFVFLTMFLAMPFFAMKVVDHARSLGTVKNAAFFLVKDLQRARDKAKTDKMSITVTTENTPNERRATYYIRGDNTIFERITQQAGINIVGKVTFGPDGVPENPSSFVISEGARSSAVNIDAQGMITSP